MFEEGMDTTSFGEDLLRPLRELLAGAHVAGPVAPHVIAAAEAELGLRFPRSYRAFLSHFGAAVGQGFEVAGIVPAPSNNDEPPLYSDVIEQTKRFRQGDVPNSLLPFSGDGCDATYCLDTACQTDTGEAPVIIWGPVDGHGHVLAPDFLQFLRAAVTEGL